MPKMRKNPAPRFEQKVAKLMDEPPKRGKSHKLDWTSAVKQVAEKYPGLLNKYIKKLEAIAKGE